MLVESEAPRPRFYQYVDEPVERPAPGLIRMTLWAIGALLGVSLLIALLGLGLIAFFAGVLQLRPEIGFPLTLVTLGLILVLIAVRFVTPRLVNPENLHLWFFGMLGLLVLLVSLSLQHSGIAGARYIVYFVLGIIASAIIAAVICGLLAFASLRKSRPLCPRCRKRIKIRDRLIGLPISLEALRDPLQAEVVATLATGDCSPLLAAEPFATIDDWMNQPALFISLGSCDGCSGPYIMTAETHGLDEARREVHLGDSIFHREIDRTAGDKFIETARQRGLITYGHQVSGAQGV